MYITKELMQGFNAYLSSGDGNPAAGIGVGLLVLEAGQTYTLFEAQKEAALLLFEGEARWGAQGEARRVSRKSPFSEEASCLHVPAGVAASVQADSHCEIYVQMVENPAYFQPVFYMPADIRLQRAGDCVLQGAMRRDIKTVFDYDNAPYSNMVLGEVLSYPGRWSSYPPHHHPQPEVYFYRFDKPQGFGAGFGNGQVYHTSHNGLLLIQGGCHSQVTAPGYGLCYVWGIRHLPGDPWKKTRIDDEAHTWMLAPGAELLRDG